jgi:hypothetical protein
VVSKQPQRLKLLRGVADFLRFNVRNLLSITRVSEDARSHSASFPAQQLDNDRKSYIKRRIWNFRQRHQIRFYVTTFVSIFQHKFSIVAISTRRLDACDSDSEGHDILGTRLYLFSVRSSENEQSTRPLRNLTRCGLQEFDQSNIQSASLL